MEQDSNFTESNRLLIDESFSVPENLDNEVDKSKMATPKSSRKVARKITEFIEDKNLRVKSYFRRRHVPLKRAFDMDLQCGTQTFMIQISTDIEEVLYYGHDKLVKNFLNQDGVTLQFVSDFIVEEKRKFGHFVEEDPDLLESLGKKKSKNHKVNHEDDDDFSPTVKEKERKNREKRKEAQKRVAEGDFLQNINERTKVFRSRKDGLVSKIAETDEVCGTKSFLIVINPDEELSFFHGDPILVTKFFENGLKSSDFLDLNVRNFEIEELEFNNCAVPHCLVTRNSLPKWRKAAIKMFNFPKNLPMTLYLCPENEREKWIAELDFDPSKSQNSNQKLAICSLHFRMGRPTENFPLPTELLSENGNSGKFKGNVENVDNSEFSEEDEDVKFTEIRSKLKRKREQKWKIAVNFRRKRRKHVPSLQKDKKKKMAIFGSKILCRYCKDKFRGTKQYFRHIKDTHMKNTVKSERKDPEEILQTAIPTPNKKKIKLPPVEVTAEEKSMIASLLYPKSRAKSMNPKKKYVCAVCKSSCDLYGLFIHMKQVHQGLLCCYCTKLFKKFSDLEIHIKSEHRVPKRYYHNSKQFQNLSGSRYNFVCSICSEIVTLKELDKHGCKSLAKKVLECPFCAREFSNSSALEIHLSNGWCAEMPKHGFEPRKIYKVLTGKEQNPEFFKPEEAKVVQKVAEKKPKIFNVSDRRILDLFKNSKPKNHVEKFETCENLPNSGQIFHSLKSRGMNPNLKKDLKESGALWKSDSKFDILRLDNNFCINCREVQNEQKLPLSDSPQRQTTGKIRSKNRRFGPKIPLTHEEIMENKENDEKTILKISIPMIKKEGKSERIARAQKEIPANFENLRKLLKVLGDNGSEFCQQVQNLNVDSIFILSHLLIHHDRQFIANYLNEDAQDSISRIKTYLRDSKQKELIFQFNPNEDYSNFCCSFCPQVFDDLDALQKCLELNHGQKMLTCQLCQNMFLNYGSFKNHICFGPGKGGKFKCPTCHTDDLFSFLDFQKHLRKLHNQCDVDLQVCENQEILSEHVMKNYPSQELMCKKCFMTYDTLQKFRQHLFFKHEEEHSECEICHQKTWPHVYHFCIMASKNICEVCDANFDNFRKYRVHLRTHTGQTPHICSVKSCKKSYVSKHLLLKHYIRRHPDMRPVASAQLESKRSKRYLEKMGATSMENIHLCQEILLDLLKSVIFEPEPEPEQKMEVDEPEKPTDEVKEIEEKVEEKEAEPEFDPIALAVASIMGSEGAFDIRKSPVKPVNPIESQIKPTPKIMPPLEPIKTLPASTKIAGESLLKNAKIDPLKEMLKTQSRPNLQTPSSILPPSSFNEIINGKMPVKSEDENESGLESIEKVPEKKEINPVLGGIWNQDLMFISNSTQNSSQPSTQPLKSEKKGCKVMKPKYQIEDDKRKNEGLKTHAPSQNNAWEVLLSESSGSENEGPKKARIVEKIQADKRVALMEHDYCFAAYTLARQVEQPKEDLSEMDKILSNVAIGSLELKVEKKHKKAKKKKKKRKKHVKNNSDSDSEVDVTSAVEKHKRPKKSHLPKPKYHIQGTSQGVTASAARPHFSSSEDENDEELTSGNELNSSDLDTDFEQEEIPKSPEKRPIKASFKAPEPSQSSEEEPETPSLKLKIKLPSVDLPPSPKLKIQPFSKAKKAKIPIFEPSSSQFFSPLPVVTDTKLYCVCQSPHDDVSEMIGCDAPDCRVEWFHFECVGIIVPPEGQWYCPECTNRYNIRTTLSSY